MSAFNFGRSGCTDGRDAVALATRGVSLDAKGSGARSHCHPGIAFACLLALVALAPATALAADPPLAITDEASAIADDSATLNGRVNPKGAAVATCRFEYGTTTDHGAVAPCQPSSLGTGSINVFVSAEIGALEPGTTYHYRLIATSVNGASQGVDRTFTTTGTPICPNADRRLEQGIQAIQLPQCMALEQVSPPRKFSQRASSPRISADGNRVAFTSLAALAETPGNNAAISGDVYVAERTQDGWLTHPTSPPPPISRGWDLARDLARSFDPSFSCWVVFAGIPEESQIDLGVGQLSRGCLGGAFQPLSPLLVPIDGGSHSSSNVTGAMLQAASADHTRLLFATGESSATYLPGDPTIAGPGADRNVFIAKVNALGHPSIELLARDDDEKAWGGSCGVRVGGIGGLGVGWRNQGAVSADGSRVYFSTRPTQPDSGACTAVNKLRIMQRVEIGGGIEVSELIQSECDREADPGAEPPIPSCATHDGDDFYQGASVDGSKVYFTTNRQLSDSDLDGTAAACSGFFGAAGCDLYLYDAARPEGERLIQVSAGVASEKHPIIGAGANVYNGTTAISGDGSHVYFVAGGVLTPDPNPEGNTAAEYLAAEPKLYGWDTSSEVIRFIGTLSTGDTSQLWGGNGTFLNAAYPVPVTGEDESGEEIGGSGHILAFQSRAALTSDDADGARLDAYHYNADMSPPTLECVSCRPGGPDSEPHDVIMRFAGSGPGVPGTAFAEQERWVSEDGSAIVLRTAQALLPSDVNVEVDDYLWRQGELTLLPGTTPPPGLLEGGERPAVLSHDGSQVAFTAYKPLLPSDIDTAPDVYVARAGGGFPNPDEPPDCVGDACQGPLSAPPAAAGAASADFLGRGNVQQRQRDCGAIARSARKFSQRAQRLRRNAGRVANPARAQRMRAQAKRLSRQASNAGRNARSCRQGSGR